MKINKLKQIIQKELKALKEQRMKAPGPAMPSMGNSMTGGPKPTGVTSNAAISGQCMAALNNLSGLTQNVSPVGQTMNENSLITENIIMRFRGAIKKLFTNCGELYDESGGPVG